MLFFHGFQKRKIMSEFIQQNIWLIFFLIWGFPLTYYRSHFRKIVYKTNDWKINLKPLFIKEIKGLFGNLYPEDKIYKKARNFYRFYLFIYFILFLVYCL